MKHILNGLDTTISLCIAFLERNDKPAYYRIADYDQANNELAAAITDCDIDDPSEKPYHPRSLFSPSAERLYNSGARDFLYLKWAYDEVGHYKYPVVTQLDDPHLGRICEPHEVIFLDSGRGAGALRDALSNEGIPLQGELTNRFYVVYDKRGDYLVAIDCNIRDFVVEDNRLILSKQKENTGSSALTAPIVYLEDSLILSPQFIWLPQRFIYSDLDELERHGYVPLRNLDYFASDYIKWFTREMDYGLSRSDTRELIRIAQNALAMPDYLEQYLGAPACSVELEKLQRKINSLAEGLIPEDIVKVGQTLLSNEQIHQACLEQCRNEADKELAGIQNEISVKLNELEATATKCQSTKEQLDAKLKEKDEIDEQITRLIKKRDEEMAAYDSIMQELDSNVALKLGLRAIVSQPAQEHNGTSVISPISYVACKDMNPRSVDHDLQSTIVKNLITLGVSSLDNANVECYILATAAVSCLPYTNIICCPHPVASALADAIAIALDGKSACRAHIPSDYRNAKELLSLIDNADSPIVLMDNIIDPVNEGILSAIINHETQRIVILPFSSHASIQLLARELWGRMFFAPAESLIISPGVKKIERCKRSASPTIPIPQKLDDIIEDGVDLAEAFENVNLPVGSRLLASATYSTALTICENQPAPISVSKRAISQHLGVSVANYLDFFRPIEVLSQDDPGLSLLERALYVE